MFVRIWEAVLRFLGRHETPRAEPQSEPVQKPKFEQQAPNVAAKPTSLVMQEVGSGNIQVGYAAGNVSSRVSHHTHTHSHAHVTVIQKSVQIPANEPRANKPSSTEHSAVLRRMDQLRDRVPVLDFMEREFGTRMVVHLKAEQLFRLNRYLDVVLRNPSAKTTKTATSRTRLKQGAHR